MNSESIQACLALEFSFMGGVIGEFILVRTSLLAWGIETFYIALSGIINRTNTLYRKRLSPNFTS